MPNPVACDERNNRDLDLDDGLAIAADCKPSLGIIDHRPRSELTRLLAERRSVRTFSTVASVDLQALLSRLLKPESSGVAPDGYRERWRPYPSAGARHPHTLLALVQDVQGLPKGAYVVAPGGLVRLAQRHGVDAEKLGAAIREAARLDLPAPLTLVTLARFRRTTEKYPGRWGESLVWRDAGALLGYAHLIAADLGLASVIIGVGLTINMRVGAHGDSLVDTGALVLGGNVAADMESST